MITVNLLPKDLRRSSGTDAWKTLAVAVPVVALLAMAGTQIYYSSQLSALNQNIADANSEIQLRAPKVAERNELQGRLTSLQAVAAVQDQLMARRSSWSGDLLTFVNRLPRGSQPLVALQTLTMRTPQAPGSPTPTAARTGGLYDGKAVTREFALTGQASSSSSLVQFLKTFENASDFGVQFQNATRDATSGDYNFTATVGLVGSSLKPAALPAAGNTTAAPAAPTGGQGAR